MGDRISANKLNKLQKAAVHEVYVENLLKSIECFMGQRATVQAYDDAVGRGEDFITEVAKRIDEKAAVAQAREDVSEE